MVRTGRRSFNSQSYYHHRRFARQPTSTQGKPEDAER